MLKDPRTDKTIVDIAHRQASSDELKRVDNVVRWGLSVKCLSQIVLHNSDIFNGNP